MLSLRRPGYQPLSHRYSTCHIDTADCSLERSDIWQLVERINSLDAPLAFNSTHSRDGSQVKDEAPALLEVFNRTGSP
jgi:hypothetical protein